MSSKRDIELLFEIGTLRYIHRTWRQLNSPDVANLAEHIYRVAWLALTLAKYEKKGNHEKILKIALVHDVPESRVGDVNYISRQYTKRDEKLAAQDIFAETIHDHEMNELLDEYEKRESIESQIVKDADNLDIELELQEMKIKGQTLPDLFRDHRRKHVFPKLYTKSARAFWQAIAKSDPHDWHMASKRNRFNGGDWKKKKSGN